MKLEKSTLSIILPGIFALPSTLPPTADDTSRRKDAHLDLCATAAVELTPSTSLFDQVQLVHQALPELSESQVDTTCSFLGKKLASPLMITGITGGTERAKIVNCGLARIADELQIGFGVGSQRAMLNDPSTASSFQVRQTAPRVALLGNLGLWQARDMGVDGVRRLMDAIDADGMAIHLNVGQEMIQPEGDRDFSGGLKVIETLSRTLGDRLVVKETGCGIGPDTARRLLDAGVKTIDISGAGGTSWVKVETLRAQESARALGELFANWGIPTAACVAAVNRLAAGRALLIASGGIRDGLMAAKAIALGAGMVGMALPVFRAFESHGLEGARNVLIDFTRALRLAMMLTGSRTLADLACQPKIISEPLTSWINGLTPTQQTT